MKVRYVGPQVAVELRLPDGTPVVVERGATLEVPEDIGRSLLEQAGNWEAASDRAKKDGE